MAPPPGPYFGTSSLALVARASAFSFGIVYGSIKLKYLQASGGNELHMLNDKTSEQVYVVVAFGGDHLDFEVVSPNSYDLKLQEEEFRRKIELEAEERKLEETLEYQRRIENEAKQKHLAEQNKRTIQAYAEKAADGLHDAYLDAGNLGIQG